MKISVPARNLFPKIPRDILELPNNNKVMKYVLDVMWIYLNKKGVSEVIAVTISLFRKYSNVCIKSSR